VGRREWCEETTAKNVITFTGDDWKKVVKFKKIGWHPSFAALSLFLLRVFMNAVKCLSEYDEYEYEYDYFEYDYEYFGFKYEYFVYEYQCEYFV